MTVWNLEIDNAFDTNYGHQLVAHVKVNSTPVISWPRRHIVMIVCRNAVNSNIQIPYRQLNFYLGTRSMNQFWNLVRRSKCTTGSTVSDIQLDTLQDYYSTRFSHDDTGGGDLIEAAEASVSNTYSTVKVDTHFIMTESALLQHTSKLRTGCAAGIDGITAEHVKWAKDTALIAIICKMLTLCVRFGIVADSFTKGLLIPLLKNPTSIQPYLRTAGPL